jgi:tryptophanyl-tRNA synthetase
MDLKSFYPDKAAVIEDMEAYLEELKSLNQEQAREKAYKSLIACGILQKEN